MQRQGMHARGYAMQLRGHPNPPNPNLHPHRNLHPPPDPSRNPHPAPNPHILTASLGRSVLLYTLLKHSKPSTNVGSSCST